MKALTSHPNGLGSTPKLVVTCELSLLLVPVLTPRVLLRILRFSSLRKHHLFKFQLEIRGLQSERLAAKEDKASSSRACLTPRDRLVLIITSA